MGTDGRATGVRNDVVSQDDIRRMVDVIVERFQPEKVILFGSYARGEAGPDSDVDLLVVKETGTHTRRDTAAAMRAAVWRVPGPKDVIVCTPRQYRRERSRAGSLIGDAHRQGKVLFSCV